MRDIPDLPQAELEIMDVLWHLGAGTVKEIQASLKSRSQKAYTTVATLLGRLRERGYVASEDRNFAYVFRPLVRREQVVKRKVEELVQRVLGGSISPLAAYIAENRKLTAQEIAVLEKIIQAESETEDK